MNQLPIIYTTTSLSDQSAINKPLATHNLQEPSRKIMIKKTKILYESYYQIHLAVREVMYIKQIAPTINFTLINIGNHLLKFKKKIEGRSLEFQPRLTREAQLFKTTQKHIGQP